MINNLQKSFRASQKTLENWEKIIRYYKQKVKVEDLTETYIFSCLLTDFLLQTQQQQTRKGWLAKLFCKFCK